MGKTTDLRIALNQNGIKWNEQWYSDDIPPKMYDRITWCGKDKYVCEYRIVENDDGEFEVFGLTIPQIIKALSE